MRSRANMQYFLLIINLLMSLIKLIIYIILLVGVLGVENFQKRYIYAGQDNNVCHFGQSSDKIRLKVNIDGYETKTIIAQGFTLCDNWIATDALRIIPAKYWLASSGKDREYYIPFIDETKRYYSFGVLTLIVQTSRVDNPVTLNGKPYSCELYGDGQVQHFGIDFPAYSPAQIYLRCDQVTTGTAPQLPQ